MNDMIKVMLIGNGYVGSEFKRQLNSSCSFKIVETPNEIRTIDVRGLRSCLQESAPDLVINAAGFVGVPNVDACERQKEQCFDSNVSLPLKIAAACMSAGVPVGHVSSGCIYNGDLVAGANYYKKVFTEEDPPNFTWTEGGGSFYSGCKAEAEKVVTRLHPEHYIWRLRIPFDSSPSERNYLQKIKQFPKLTAALNSYSHLGDFVWACLRLVLCSAPYGIYNLTNPGSMHTSDIADMVYRSTCFRKWEFQTVAQHEAITVARRSNCVLSVEKACQYVKIRPVHKAFEDAIRLLKW
jgi:3,5-epimerase/4-reductase